jgi:hypothetical protein
MASKTSKFNLSVVTLFAVANACGTVAGNPKKPSDTQQPTTGEKVALPLIGFDFSEGALADDTPLQLADSAPSGGDKSVFNAYGRRLKNVIREVNATSKRFNDLLETEQKNGSTQDVNTGFRFKGKGKKSNMNFAMKPIVNAEYSYEAVLCASSKPIQLYRWSKDGQRIELWRDFAVVQGEGELVTQTVSKVKVTKGAQGETLIDVSSLGSWTDTLDPDASSSGGLAERMKASQDTLGNVTFKASTDRFEGATPTNFTADAYISARLAKSGKNHDGSFVAYSAANSRLLCRSGFNETSENIWKPVLGQPRFCLGRAPQGNSIQSFSDFQQLVASFESVGIVKQTEIEAVSFPPNKKCD